MILDLHVRNFTLIGELYLNFKKGLNILTGETGAGKTIIVDAINALIGEGGDRSSVRTGEKEAVIEGTFEISQKLKNYLKEKGIDVEDNTIYVKRVISLQGKSRCWVNNEPVSLKFLKEIGDELIDMHGQHEHQSLLKPEKQLEILDAFCKLQKERERLKKLWLEINDKKEKLERMKKEFEEFKKQKEFYEFQLEMIENANLYEGEDEEIEKELNLLENYEKNKILIDEAINLLYEREDAVIDMLKKVLFNLKELSNNVKEFEDYAKQIEDILINASEIAKSIADFRDKFEYDPQKLEELRKRKMQIQELKDRFGKSVKEILEYGERLKKILASFEESEEGIKNLENEIRELESEYYALSNKVSHERKKGARNLEKKVESELKLLGMPKACFKIKIETRPPFHYGIDKVEFLFSANPGEKPLHLRRIASGGELSRCMLALKSVFAKLDEIPILIFDEIDIGTSGKIADTIGEKLKVISQHHQVICITHLPQIASKADHHIKVWKEEKEGRTFTFAKPLSYEERVEEIAMLLSGKKITPSAIEHAKQLLGIK